MTPVLLRDQGPSCDLLDVRLQDLRSVLDDEDRKWNAASKFPVRLTELDSAERLILASALTDVQVESKLWLLDQLCRQISIDGHTVIVLGGWCGVLPWLANLTGRGSAATWISIDRDPEVCSIGRRAFGAATPNLSFACYDIYDFDFRQLARKRRSIIINTICEHLHDFSRWRAMLPKGEMTVLQSNNYRGCRDHVNCADSTDELVAKAGLAHVLFQGSLALSLFTRFMVIGRA